MTSNRASHEASDSTSALPLHPLAWVVVFRDGKDTPVKSGSECIKFGLGEGLREKG